MQGFEFFGGVPYRITYDNTKIAVAQIIGGTQERRLTRGFCQLKSHYLFDHHFCRVARGNEKGVVEGRVIEGLSLGHRLFKKFRWWKPLNAAAGGLVVAGVGGLISTRFLGLGLDIIEDVLAGKILPKSAFLWKALTTSITLGCGGSGGIVTPIFFLGTTAGNLFSNLFGLGNVATYSAIGMVAMLAGAANTPISASVMAIELFGSGIAPYAAIACVVSFLMSGHRSVYPSQVLSIQKSESVEVETGKPIGQVQGVGNSEGINLPKKIWTHCLSLFRRR